MTVCSAAVLAGIPYHILGVDEGVSVLFKCVSLKMSICVCVIRSRPSNDPVALFLVWCKRLDNPLCRSVRSTLWLPGITALAQSHATIQPCIRPCSILGWCEAVLMPFERIQTLLQDSSQSRQFKNTKDAFMRLPGENNCTPIYWEFLRMMQGCSRMFVILQKVEKYKMWRDPNLKHRAPSFLFHDGIFFFFFNFCFLH